MPQWKFSLLDPHVLCSYDSKQFASGFHGSVWLLLAFPRACLRCQCKREETASIILICHCSDTCSLRAGVPPCCPFVPHCWVELEKLASILSPLVSLTRVLAASHPAWLPSALGNTVPSSTLALGCRKKPCFTVCARNRYPPVPCQGGANPPLPLQGCGQVQRGAVEGRQCCSVCKAKSEGLGWAQASSLLRATAFHLRNSRVWPR